MALRSITSRSPAPAASRPSSSSASRVSTPAADRSRERPVRSHARHRAARASRPAQCVDRTLLHAERPPNLDGPFFTNDLTPFVNGVDDDYPQRAFRRRRRHRLLGRLRLLKVSLGAFDGRSLTSAVSDKHAVLGAARLMVDFWDKEEGYLLRSSFYGASNILALGDRRPDRGWSQRLECRWAARSQARRTPA